MSGALQLAVSGLYYSADPDTGLRRTAANTQALSVGGLDYLFSTTAFTLPAGATIQASDGADLGPLIGEIRMWALPTAPTGWLFLFGQACTTSYPLWRAALVAASNPFGTSGGDPLFPDLRCVVPAGKGNMGGTDRALLTGSTTLGALLGLETATISVAQLPSANFPVSGITLSDTRTWAVTGGGVLGGIVGTGLASGSPGVNNVASGAVTPTLGALSVSAQGSAASGGSGTGHANVQPTIVINYIARAA